MRVREICRAFLAPIVLFIGPHWAWAQPTHELAAAAVIRVEVISVTPDSGRLRKQRIVGSGVIVTSQGHVVTNAHVARQAVRARCWLADGSERAAEIIGIDPVTDLAVLRLTNKNPAEVYPVATWADDEIKAGDAVWALGSPGNLSKALTAGIVANPRLFLPGDARFTILDGEQVGRLVRWIAHDAAIYPGNSGGPLVNAQGRVVGINDAVIAGLGAAIPSVLAKRVVEELIAHGSVKRAWLGVRWQSLLTSSRPQQGVLVAAVFPDSAAARAGLQAGDQVLRIAGKAIAVLTPEALVEVENIEEALKIGQAVDIEFIRNGVSKQARVLPDSRPPAQLPPRELRSLGAIVRDLTPFFLFQTHRVNTKGVWVESVRSGHPLAQAKPPIYPGDIITAFNGKPIDNAADLSSTLERGFTDAIVTFERSREIRLTLLEGVEPSSGGAVSAKRAWLGVTTQVLEKPLARKMGVENAAAIRITEVYPETTAAAAGLQVGDIIVGVDGERPVIARHDEEHVFQELIRARRPGQSVMLSLLRGNTALKLDVVLAAQPSTPNDMKRLEIPEIEASLREPTAMDRIDKGISKDAGGLVVEQVEPAGWADIGGLQAGDVLLEVAGTPMRSISDLDKQHAKIRKAPPQRLPLVVRRGPRDTLFLEIDWSPLP